MCVCTPVHLQMAYCGRELVEHPRPILDANGAITGKMTPRISRGFCRHPDFGIAGKTLPSTVRPDGSWLAIHAHEWRAANSPKPPPAHRHPKVVALHVGFTFSDLEKLANDLRQAAEGKTAHVDVPFTTEMVTKLAARAHLPSAQAQNSGARDSASHYLNVAHQVADAARALDDVLGQVVGKPLPDKAKLTQLAQLTEHAAFLLDEALRGMHQPPADVGTLSVRDTPLGRGEPA